MGDALPDKYRNRVVNEDVMAVLKDLPDDCVDVVYGDPDYNLGIEYAGRRFAFTWDEYIDWYIDLARECLRVLRPTGNMFLINYPKQNAHLRVKFLDDAAWAVHDYVWVYNTNIGHSPKRFTTAHRSILHATKSKDNHFYKDQVAQPYKNPTDPRIRERLRNGHKGRMPYSWLNFELVKNVSRQKTVHPCQIPEGLSELLLKSCTRPNDTAFILFGGSGSEVIQARNLGLTFLTCEIQAEYCEIIESRLRSGGDIDVPYRHHTRLSQMKGSVRQGSLRLSGEGVNQMTDARLYLVLSAIRPTGLPPEDLTPEEVKYLIDNELVTTDQVGTRFHAFHIAPNQSVNFDDVPEYPPIDGLTAKGEQELKRVTERMFGRRP